MLSTGREENVLCNGDYDAGRTSAPEELRIGGIGWLSADGTRSNLTWCVLTNAVVTNALPLRGGLNLDQTGTFSNQLVAVASDSSDQLSEKGVWLVDASGHPTLLTQIYTRHLEGAITLTNDTQKWGPWAGKILTGDEVAADENLNPRPLIYTINTNGAIASYALGIAPEDFDIIPTNQDLYCVNYQDSGLGQILKLSRTLLSSYVGDLLITQAGERPASPNLFVVNWDNTITNFVVHSISLPESIAGHFEHVTFAPINLPPLQ